jgi:fluoroacetyl-CoA thioesterase
MERQLDAAPPRRRLTTFFCLKAGEDEQLCSQSTIRWALKAGKARLKDAPLPPVLATPIMIMENAALNASKPYLDAGENALGTRVDVHHLAATPAGRRVTGEARVTNTDGRRIEFSVRATDGHEEIGVGKHERVVIELTRLSERMKAKFCK